MKPTIQEIKEFKERVNQLSVMDYVQEPDYYSELLDFYSNLNDILSVIKVKVGKK